MAEAEKLILRSSRKMFMGVGSDTPDEYKRLRGFTSLSENIGEFSFLSVWEMINCYLPP